MDKSREYITNPDLLTHWQRGIQKNRLVRGRNGEVGSQRKLYINIRAVHKNDGDDFKEEFT